MNYKVPFFVPDIGQKEIDAVVRVMESQWITGGPMVRNFEDEFSKLFENSKKEVFPVAVNSATAGLHLALAGCRIGGGDEVITSTLTFTATAEAIENTGAKVRLVDIDPVSLNMDVEHASKLITDRTKAIIPVHYAGLSCDMDPIYTLAGNHGIKVIEDAAHALSSSYNQQIIGSLDSDATVFSFYANKTITTAEGGMVVTANKDLAENFRIARHHGIDKNALERATTNSAFYDVVAQGYKYNLTDIAAAIGIEQLKKLPEILKRREQLAAIYLDELKSLPLILPQGPKTGDIHPWHLFVIRVREDANIDRDTVIKELFSRGIQTSIHYTPIHKHPYWKSLYSFEESDFPFAEKIFKSIISIPLYTRMTNSEQEYVIQSLHEVLN